MTDREIESIIDDMFAGEPGPPHGEWEPGREKRAARDVMAGKTEGRLG